MQYFKNRVSVDLVLSLTVLTLERQKRLAAVLGERTDPFVNGRVAYAEKARNVTELECADNMKELPPPDCDILAVR